MSPSRPTSATRRAATLLGALALAMAALGACSSDSDGGGDEPTSTTSGASSSTTEADRDPIDPAEIEGGEQAYIDAFLAIYGAGDESFTQEQADCLAPAWVDAITLEGFAEAGIPPEDISEGTVGIDALGIDQETAEQMVASMAECGIDLQAGIISSYTQGSEVPAEVLTCLEETITPEVASDAFVRTIVGETEPPPAFSDVEDCFALAATTTTGG